MLSVNQFVTFIVGAGGFGGKRSSQHAKVISIHTLIYCYICTCYIVRMYVS